ncbi:anti-sigma factor family protein [Aromatoleum evansii]|uniref:Zf-HC2 domain-containing protein n=1 Tax=Aromatoleum evansii TaxID=59406 RepID=A0ABZ1AUC9_AROEV|nr:zf-HC2 domain-containing protein [Aromatoleum evansii]NMG30901.1 anti-sigma factor [Aromatoleum evansii]WRL48591.1 zf-HC2 domain-containing protein [Aromatoleum evansii]
MTEQERMHCDEVVASLLEYLDGEIDDARRALIDDHLAECRGCFSRAEFERALRDRMRSLASAPPPDSLRRRLKAIIDEF